MKNMSPSSVPNREHTSSLIQVATNTTASTMPTVLVYSVRVESMDLSGRRELFETLDLSFLGFRRFNYLERFVLPNTETHSPVPNNELRKMAHTFNEAAFLPASSVYKGAEVMKNRVRMIYGRQLSSSFCADWSAVLYFTEAPKMVATMTHLGYPIYFLKILGTAKILGVLAISV